MERKSSELSVITQAKDLCSYVMTVTQKSPKQYRFTFTSRLQNLSLDVVEKLYRANEIFLSADDPSSVRKRLDLQHEAMTDLKLLAYFSVLSAEQKCILFRQYEQIAKLASECQRLLGGWIVSDRKRLQPQKRL